MVAGLRKTSLAFATILMICGCEAGGERPFQQTQFCLTNEAGADELRRVLTEIARQEGLAFTDRSSDAEAELKDLDVPMSKSFPLIMISMRGNETGLSASNAGLPSDQVVVGFSPNTAEERGFAARAVRRLGQTWKLFKVPDGQGAFPLGCA